MAPTGDEADDEQVEELKRCAADPVYFINTFGWTFNPNLLYEPWVRFTLFEWQVEYVHWLVDLFKKREDGVVLKGREVGFSWVNVAVAVWFWLFHPAVSVGFGSNVKENVDVLDDPNSLFEKMRLFIRRLPLWMLPSGFNEHKHMLLRRITNPETGATIVGKIGKQMGRGARFSIFFADEFAFYENADKADAAISRASECKIFGSTPNGMGNAFHRKATGGILPLFKVTWRVDPRYNGWVLRNPDGSIFAEGRGPGPNGCEYPWYDMMCRKLEYDPVRIAQELDASFEGSSEGVVIPYKWVEAAIEYDELPATGLRASGMDIAQGGKNKTIIGHRVGPVVVSIGEIVSDDTTLIAYEALRLCEDHDSAVLAYDGNLDGIGVGSVMRHAEMARKPELVAVLGGASPSDDVWPDDRTSKERFLNRRAELAWKLRTRFENSYKRRVLGHDVDPADCISIPNRATLLAQLSVPKVQRTSRGNVKVESKEDMRKRGVLSPDEFDMLMYLFDDSPMSATAIMVAPIDQSVSAINSWTPR